MNECLGAGSTRNKAARLKQVEENIRANDWRTFRAIVLEVLNRKHPLGLNNERADEFAERITNELIENGIDVGRDENGLMEPLPLDKLFLFKKKFKEACNDYTGGAFKTASLMSKVWLAIGTEKQELWKLAHDELAEAYQYCLKKGGGGCC